MVCQSIFRMDLPVLIKCPCFVGQATVPALFILTSTCAIKKDNRSIFPRGQPVPDYLQYILLFFEYLLPFVGHDHKNFFANRDPLLYFFEGGSPCNFSID
jgi:hypothetical protein